MYTGLHNHTMYSNIRLLDCIIKPSKLLDRALDMGLKGIAITDHACLSGHVEIQQHYDNLKKQGKIPNDFKLILGDEVYLTPNLESKGEYYHQILLAKDEVGHRLLREIETRAWKNSYNYKNMDRVPITFNEVAEIIGDKKGHLFSTSACIGSYLGKKISIWKQLERDKAVEGEVLNVKQEIHNYLVWCLEVFKDDFYLEVQPSDTFEQIQHNEALKVLSMAYNIPLIFSTDSHYLSKEDRYYHECFLNSKEGDREVADFYKTTYLMPYEEIKKYLSITFSDKELEQMRINTISIGDSCEYYSLYKPQVVPKCNFDLSTVKDFSKTNYYKNIDRLLDGCDEDKYWIRYCLQSLQECGKFNNQYLKRLDIESNQLYLISQKLGQHLSSYFILMQKVVSLAWNHSLVGIGRGSSVGWLSNYLLGITGIDPVAFGLNTWWRFAHEDRVELADIDTDFSPLKKEEIMQELKKEFGEDNIINCATFGTCSSKSAIQTACRGLGIDNDTSQYISSMIPVDRGALWTLTECFEGNLEKDKKPIAEFIKEVAKYPNLKEVALEFEGLVDKRSSHASAVYIFNDGVSSCNCMMKSSNGLPITQFSMKDSDYMSALKIDILWTEAQAKLQTCLELLIEDGLIEDKGSLKANYDEYLHPDKLNQTDIGMWESAYNGEIIDLFQYSTSLGLEALKKTKPTNLAQATSTNSLMRLMSGESDVIPIDKYVIFKNDISKWYKEMESYYLNAQEQKLLEPYLLVDYGVANTQETLMEVVMAVGCSMEQANKARKTIAKKVFRDIDKLKEMVFEVGKDNGHSMNLLNYIWDNVVIPQAGYGFSILHSTVYSIIAIQMMNLFYFYPRQYWNTAVLIVNAGVGEDSSSDYSKIAVAIGNMKSNNVEVSLPDINKSDSYFRPDKNSNKILYGLKGIVTINDEDIKNIIDYRPYNSLKDFLDKCSNFMEKGKITTLIKSGCFDELENINRYDIMKKYIVYITKIKETLTSTNLAKVIDNNLLENKFLFEKELYKLRKYIFSKQFLYKTTGSKKWYMLDDFSYSYFEKYFIDDLEEDKDYKYLVNGRIVVCDKPFDKIYKRLSSNLLEWLQTSEAVNLFNILLLNEQWHKYVKSNDIRTWEMESCCFYNDKHELSDIDKKVYNIVNYLDLPEVPIVLNESIKKGRLAKTLEINSIMGTVIDKNTTRHTISLLTESGVVTVKFSKGAFNFYNKQISKVDTTTGKKSVIEKSWFSRGSLLIVKGFREGNQFRARAYTGHSVLKILGIREEKYLWLQGERAEI